MDKKRLFVAINLPKEINQKINDIIHDLMAAAGNKDLRWIPTENLHLTISFLGLQPDEAIDKILKSIKETAEEFKCPEIEFEKIILAPSGKKPRMVWLAGSKESSEIINRIKDKLEDSLIDEGVRFRQELRAYNAHINLARFRNIDERTLNALKTGIGLPAGGLKIESAIRFKARSIDLMESESGRSGARYTILSSALFGSGQ